MKKFFLLVLLIFSFCAFHVDDACAKRVGAWDVWQKVDEMDDSTLLGAITISKTGVRNSAGIVKYPGLGIIIRKNSDIAMCVLQEMPWLGTQSDIEIQYRWEKKKLSIARAGKPKNSQLFLSIQKILSLSFTGIKPCTFA